MSGQVDKRPLPDKTQRSQETGFDASGGIRTRSPSKLQGAESQLIQHGHQYRQLPLYLWKITLFFFVNKAQYAPRTVRTGMKKIKSFIQPGFELRNLQGVGIHHINYTIPISVILVHIKILCILVLPARPMNQFNSKRKLVSASLMLNIFA